MPVSLAKHPSDNIEARGERGVSTPERIPAKASEEVARLIGNEALFVLGVRMGGGLDLEQDMTERSLTGIPELDGREDYEPQFPGQILMHRSNADLQPGDIVLSSDQISDEMHDELNRGRGFTSTSSPRGSGGYDRKLAHAGTRDYGAVYGDTLYVVEPLEGDTVKWGENFGGSYDVHTKASSPGIRGSYRPDGFTQTDSRWGKYANEAVSTKGFRVVRSIPHEPDYEEAILPWPVSRDALEKKRAREESRESNVSTSSPGSSESNSASTWPISRNSRKRPGAIGPVQLPGVYRAGADRRNPAEYRTRLDVWKQHTENPGQLPIPGISMSRYGRPDRWAPIEHMPPEAYVDHEKDTPLPGMEDYEAENSMASPF